ncbi:MAG TPA: sigma-70 family RNA polymerase sigma factor [Anaerolineae bacterium]|nr:sigma-70 family RNA polymerase sigma factor [Anaerolineae bacterium]
MTQESVLPPTVPASEAALVERAAARDPDAIARLYDLYAPKIQSFIYHRTSDPFVTEDLTAQVFLRVLEAMRGGKEWHTSFSGWIYRIAHNLIVDYYRKRSQSTYTNIDDAPHLPAGEGDPYRLTAAKLDRDALLRAINQLTDEQAQVITLRFLEGYSIAEVARLMNKSEGAIKALQFRGMVALRRILTQPL